MAPWACRVWGWGGGGWGGLWLRTPALGEDFPTRHTLFLCPSREKDLLGLCLQLCLRAQAKAGRGPSGTWPVTYPSQAVHRQGKASAAPLSCCHGRALCRGDRHWWPEQAGSVLGWENAICRDLRLGAESANKSPIEREPSGSLLKQLGGGGHSVLCRETVCVFHLFSGPLASNRVLTMPGSGSPHV